MARKNLSKWEKLLECFVKYDHSAEDVFEKHAETMTDWLYDQVNDAGFRLRYSRKISTTRHTELVRRAVRGVFSHLWKGGEDSSIQIRLHNSNSRVTYNYNAGEPNKATSITAEDIPVTVVVDRGGPYFYDLGRSGDAGLVFVMNFCLQAAEVNHVVSCKECRKFFFSKRSDAMYCSPNCKTNYNRGRDKCL